jgi:beta-galactosidase GanA
MKTLFQLFKLAALAALLPGFAGPQPVRAADANLPRIVTRDGRHALFVDGAPFLLLGDQSHNSSDWPALLPKVWPAIDYLHANTLETPVYWEQFEPQPGKFDPSNLDLLLKQAREHHVRLVLLWFGTWKNGSSHYEPLWMKSRPDLYPRILGRDGRRSDSPSPHAPATLEADKHAFSALMRHLKSADRQHTVIMVQVENEPGSWGSVRDFSPMAEKLFHAPVPAELLQAMGPGAPGGGTWPEVFGTNADEYFNAWSIARFIGQVAAAGKAEDPLPMYVNVALRDPLTPGSASHYESGGATDNVLWIWKAAAPAIDVLAPDNYQNDSPRYYKVLDLYSRPDNALLVPETLNSATGARMCFAALGHGAIGWSPFGLDYTPYATDPIGAPRLTEASLASLALSYRLLEPVMREVAHLNFEGKLQAVAEEPDTPSQTLDFGPWRCTINFGNSGRNGAPHGNATPVGRALIGQLGENEFLVTGAYCWIDFKSVSGEHRDFVHVEEGGDVNGRWQPLRIWNGDETDWGLNFTTGAQALHVTLGTF